MKNKIIEKVGWKPVQIDGNVFSDANDLVGIEVCTDYSINNIKNNKTRKRKLEKTTSKKQLAKKRRKKDEAHGQTSAEPQAVDANDDISPSQQGSTINAEAPCNNNIDEFETDSVKAWTNYGLPESILKAIAELKFIQPTEIQALTLPAAVLGRKDILGAAETGSGKTLAFGLPMLVGILKVKAREEKDSKAVKQASSSDRSDSEEEAEVLLDSNYIGCVKSVNNIHIEGNTLKPLYGLILTPTRELAMQVRKHLTAVAKYTGINIAVVVGGMAAVKQERILNKCPEIVVATPGRLWELIQSGNPHLSQVDKIRFLAIDETDRMLEKGHFQELQELLEKINMDDAKRKQRQNFVFSATLTLVHELPKYLANKKRMSHSKKIKELTPAQKLQKIIDMLGITSPKIVDITQGTGTSSTLTECKITCAIDEKDYYVYYFLRQHPGRTLIFCNSIGCVKRLTNLLGVLECKPLPLHASMQQRQRLKNLERFAENENGILIATDVAARGLDIPSVEHVLHYQTPRTSEGYVHRSGRTARASKQGITVLIMEPGEVSNYIKLCRTLQKTEDLPNFPINDHYLNAVKERVNLARDLDKLQLQVRKTNSQAGWLQKAAEEMDMIVEDRDLKYEMEDASKAKKVAELKRKELDRLLAKPIFPRGFSGKFALIKDLPALEELQKANAISVMKEAIEKEVGNKKNKKKLAIYKPTKLLKNK